MCAHSLQHLVYIQNDDAAIYVYLFCIVCVYFVYGISVCVYVGQFTTIFMMVIKNCSPLLCIWNNAQFCLKISRIWLPIDSSHPCCVCVCVVSWDIQVCSKVKFDCNLSNIFLKLQSSHTLYSKGFVLFFYFQTASFWDWNKFSSFCEFEIDTHKLSNGKKIHKSDKMEWIDKFPHPL